MGSISRRGWKVRGASIVAGGAIALILSSACAGNHTIRPVVIEGTASTLPIPLPVSGGMFIPGEQMTFRLSVRGVEGGEAVIAIGHPGTVKGRKVVIVRSRVESSGLAAVIKEVRDDSESWIDLNTGYPVYLKADMKFGRIESLLETEFSGGGPGSFKLSYTNKGQRRRTLHQLMPVRETPFDGHSIIGALRAWRAPVNQAAYFYLLAGKRLWRNTVKVTGREEIETALGDIDAVRIDGEGLQMTQVLRIDPTKKVRRFTAWISDDERRLPLLLIAKTEYGDVRVELIDYQTPATAAR